MKLIQRWSTVSISMNQSHEVDTEMEHGEYKEHQLHEADTEIEHGEYKEELVA